MDRIINENKKWIDEVWEKIERKLSKTAVLSKDKIPYSTKNGIHDDNTERTGCWTNGFWPGLMWIMYDATRDEKYKETAEIVEEKLDKSLFNYEALYHDVGFMWHVSAGANYRLTGSKKSKNRN